MRLGGPRKAPRMALRYLPGTSRGRGQQTKHLHFFQGSSSAAERGCPCMSRGRATAQLYSMTFFGLFLSPLPLGSPGEGPDCHVPKEIYDFGPILARIRG